MMLLNVHVISTIFVFGQVIVLGMAHSLLKDNAVYEEGLLKGHIQRIFLNLLLFCMLTEYVQGIILLKTV